MEANTENEKPVLLGDNFSSYFLTCNTYLHQHSKQIYVRYHYIGERHSSGDFDLHFINGKDNPADLLTKALGIQNLRHVISLIFQ